MHAISTKIQTIYSMRKFILPTFAVLMTITDVWAAKVLK